MNRAEYMQLRETLVHDGWMKRTDNSGITVSLLECTQLMLTLWLIAKVDAFGVGYWCLQVWLALSMFRAFVLVHECGHATLFDSKKLNRIFGRIFGVVSLLPADNWRIVHFQHHIWVGVVDKDPTSIGILDVKKYSPEMRKFYNFLWKLRLPLAAIGGVVKAFWLFPLVQARAGNRKNMKIGLLSNALTLAPWALAIYVLGIETVLIFVGPALVLYYVWFESINLTHHAGLYKHISSSHPKAIPLYEQAPYCRTARLPSWFSLVTCYHFNMHTEHHLFPTIPWHRIPELKRMLDKRGIENYIEVEFLEHMKFIRESDPFVLFIDSAPGK